MRGKTRMGTGKIGVKPGQGRGKMFGIQPGEGCLSFRCPKRFKLSTVYALLTLLVRKAD